MKTKTIILLTCFILLGIETFAQTSRFYETNPDRKRANVWSFGNLALVDFNAFPPLSKSGGRMQSLEGISCICDTSGNILFYTNGNTVWNKNHDTVENGSGLFSQLSSTQSSLILKHPDNDSLIFISTAPFDYWRGFRINIMKTNFNNGLGKVTLKNYMLYPTCTEKQTAVNHQNNKDIWVLGHTFINNIFFAYLINKDGPISCPVLSSTGGVLDNLGAFKGNVQGYLKVSHNSKFLANTIMYDKKVEIFNFSNLTGKIKILRTLNLNYMPYGLEFSTNDSNLFITGLLGDTNYVSVANIYMGTVRLIRKYKLGQIEAIQLKGDVIYLASIDSTNIKAIDQIDQLNTTNFNNNKRINLIFPQSSSIGLPNFNQSYFYTPSIDFAYNYNCINNSIDFEGRDTFYTDTYKWVIGKVTKPTEATYTTKSITHFFNDTGTYQVRYIATKGNRSDTVIKKLMIYPKIRKDFLGRDTAYETGTSFSKTLKAPLGMHCYYWQKDSSTSASFQADTTGIFICRITSQSFCVVTDTIVISSCINDLAVPILTRTLDSLYASHSLADSFIWYRNGLQYRITNVPNLALSDTGIYRVEAAKKGHCNRSSNSQYVNKLGTNYPGIIPDAIKVYPNPTKEILNIEFERHDNYVILVYDLVGKIVLRLHTDSNLDLNLKEFSEGIYLLHITNTKNEQANFKIIKV